MTQEHSSKLSFSIEESVWLNKGQEVDEIVSLSLDPEITVQEQGEYVLIRGGLKLTGEYRSSPNSSAEENESLTSQVAFRSIEEVTMNEDGIGEIKHHFPIDVTIPQERIRSLDDIFVIVDSFDYDLPERGCIQLTADISITGMSAGSSNRVVSQNEEKEDRNFHFEAYHEEQQVEEEDNTVVQFPTEEHTPYLEEVDRVEEEDNDYDEERPEDVVEVVEMNEEAVVEETAQAVEELKSPAIAFGVVKNRPTEKENVVAETPTEKTEKTSFSIAKSFKAQGKNVKQPQQGRNEQEEVEAKEQTEEAKPPREENALYLTKMLTKGEGEQFKKLKICIIRENETLETIAARYEIAQSTLIRVNRLNDTNVEEGQILYIPVTQ